MHKGYSYVRGLVKTNPLALATLKDKNLIKYANSLLPYSTGMEFECTANEDTFKRSRFEKLNLLSVDTSVGQAEHRFRIHNGIQGFIDLYNLSIELKRNLLLNERSGIHYHIDATEHSYWKQTSDIQERLLYIINNRVMKALEAWNYKGTYNSWKVSDYKTAVRMHSYYRTFEFRIGEMTFDYELLLKRVMNCQNISSMMKASLNESLKIETKHKEEEKLAKIIKMKKVFDRLNLTVEDTIHTFNNRFRSLSSEEKNGMETEQLIDYFDDFRRLHGLSTWR